MQRARELYPSRSMKIRDGVFAWGTRTYVMGIVNLSPDSFSGDGLSHIETALEQARKMVDEGADIIDVGAESTRPSFSAVAAEEEMKRLIPFIREASKWLAVPISADTYKLDVARAALDAGANMLNDVSSLEDPGLAKLAADRGVPIVLMSNERGRQFSDPVEAVVSHSKELAQTAMSHGVPAGNIVLDPGIGFGKDKDQNLEVMRRLEELVALGYPVLLGTSRKSFIGLTLDADASHRVEGTAATVAVGICKGVDIVRVHDVHHMKLVCKMCDAIVRGGAA